MKNLILILVTTLFMSGAWAYSESGTCNIQNSGLPDAMIQKLKLDCEKLRLDALAQEEVDKQAKKAAKVVEESQPLVTPEKLTSWATVAEGFAKAVGSAARELGVSVNEFIKTPAGIITMIVILWKMLGSALVSLSAIIALGLILRGVARRLWIKEVSIAQNTGLFGRVYTKTTPVFYTYKEVPESAAAWSGFLLFLFLSVSLVLIIRL